MDEADTLPEDVMTYGEEGAGDDDAGEAHEEGEEDNIELDLQTLESSSTPALETRPSLPLPLPPKVIWEGVLDMSTMSEMPSAGYLKKKCHTRALHVSGPDMKDISIEQSMPVKGKISVPKLYNYLGQIEASPSRAVTVAVIEPVGDDNTLVYTTAYTYFVDQVNSLSLPSLSPFANIFLATSGGVQRAAIDGSTPLPRRSLRDTCSGQSPTRLPFPFKAAIPRGGFYKWKATRRIHHAHGPCEHPLWQVESTSQVSSSYYKQQQQQFTYPSFCFSFIEWSGFILYIIYNIHNIHNELILYYVHSQSYFIIIIIIITAILCFMFTNNKATIFLLWYSRYHDEMGSGDECTCTNIFHL